MAGGRPKLLCIYGEVPTKQSSLEFTMDLLDHTGVAVIPGNALVMGRRFIRMLWFSQKHANRSCQSNQAVVEEDLNGRME